MDAAGEFKVGVRLLDDGQCAVVDIVGELDVLTAPRVEAILADLLGSGIPSVVDLAGIGFMDSAGINSFIRAVKDHPGLLWLASPGAPIRRLLEITGADGVLPIHPTVDEALSGMAGQADA